MHRSSTLVLLAIGVGWTAPAWAQEEAPRAAPAAPRAPVGAPAEADPATGEAAERVADTEVDQAEEAGEVAGEGAAAAGQVVDAESPQQAGEVAGEGAAAAGQTAGQAVGAGVAGQGGAAKVGPGGRPMRTDYPGTDEAMRERIETERIEGVASGEVSTKEVYDVRVQEIETRIDDLKDKVFRSKSRIVLLREMLLGNAIGASKGTIAQVNKLGDNFDLMSMTYVLDGEPLLTESVREGSPAREERFVIFDGGMSPGAHRLAVELKYQGAASVFSYFEGYKFNLRRACRFSIEEGVAATVEVIAYRRGGANTPIEEQPALRCEVKKSAAVAADPALEAQ